MVTKTIKQIDDEHDNKIQNIRALYLEMHEVSHEEYHNQLNAENERYKNELLAGGYSLGVAPTHWQQEWAKADTIDKKISILARVQGLESF